MKDINKAAEFGAKKLSRRRGLYSSDMTILISEARSGDTNALYYALKKAFDAGAGAGYRQAQADAKRAKRQRLID